MPWGDIEEFDGLLSEVPDGQRQALAPLHALQREGHDKLLQTLTDSSRGEMALLMRVPAETYLVTHNHLGRVVLYTIKGDWRYMEHDWIAR